MSPAHGAWRAEAVSLDCGARAHLKSIIKVLESFARWVLVGSRSRLGVTFYWGEHLNKRRYSLLWWGRAKQRQVQVRKVSM